MRSPFCQIYKPTIFFKTKFPKVEPTWGNWLIHCTKHRKKSQLQSLEL